MRHVHVHAVVAADGHHYPLLQDTQQLGLQFQLQLADFVEEHRPAVGRAEAADGVVGGPSERPLHVAKHVAGEERAGNRGQSTGMKRLVGTAGSGAHSLGDQFLAGAAGARNHDAGGIGCHGRDHGAGLRAPVGLADNASWSVLPAILILRTVMVVIHADGGIRAISIGLTGVALFHAA